jgi:hypothetical protein
MIHDGTLIPQCKQRNLQQEEQACIEILMLKFSPCYYWINEHILQ